VAVHDDRAVLEPFGDSAHRLADPRDRVVGERRPAARIEAVEGVGAQEGAGADATAAADRQAAAAPALTQPLQARSRVIGSP
jgi:hypothetical protein